MLLPSAPGLAVPIPVVMALATALMASGCSELGAAAQTTEQVQVSEAHANAVRRIEFPTSFVHEVPSASGRRYQVWVDLPASYSTSTKLFPVVFVTDPNFAFGITRTVRNFTGQRGTNIEDFILVGLVHDPDVTPKDSRSRDYTPTKPGRAATRGNSYNAKSYGEAEAYREYVESRVFPLIAKTYRADMGRKTYIGHSYGSLFGLYSMFTRPGMFQNYILGSPSLWFDDDAMGRIEEAFAGEHRRLPARVVMVAGSFETYGPTPRHFKNNDLVGDMQRFEKRLKARGYAGLDIRSEVAEGEDHFTVFHDVVTRGLITLLPGRGPYSSG